MKTNLVLFDVHQTDEPYFKSAFGQDYNLTITDQGLTGETVKLAAEAEVIAVHVTSLVTAALMAKMPRLKHIACRSTGFDHVDLEYAAKHGITVSTVPSYGENTVAEYAFMLLLALARKLMPAAHSVHAGIITTEKLTGTDLAGKTLGIIGTGRIGRHAAMIGRGFGMTVAAFDPYPNEQAATEIGYTYHGLHEVLAASDFISLHAPATKETFHILDQEALEHIKPGAIVVNTARGTLIDTPALVRALVEGRVSGAGLDVLEGEEYLQLADEVGLLERHELGTEAKHILNIDLLSKLPNVIITQHNAYNSSEALRRIAETAVANIKAWRAGEPSNLLALKL